MKAPASGQDYSLRITGGSQLTGDLCVSGSKNAALPEMAAAILTSEPVRLTNVPKVTDTVVMAQILTALGGRTEGGGSMVLRMGNARGTSVPDELGRRMRATILLLGALLGRFGQARLPRPGGDDIGARRVEQHLRGLRQMGARIEESATEIVAEVDRLRGERIVFDLPTVTGAEHTVIADYLEAGTYAIAVAAAGGELKIECSSPEDLHVLLLKLELAGAHVQTGDGWFHVGRRARTRVKPIDMSTWTFPGFPTDLQAQYMALMTQAEGETVISEYVHENRFQHVTQLAKMGAGITVEGRLHAVVHGPCRLRGTEVSIPDIRSGAALVIAALCAEGQSVLRNAWHVERGYEDMAGKLASVGAQIEKVSIDSDGTGAERTYE